MATQADVRRIAMALEGTQEKPGHFAFEVPVKGARKGYAWVWLERLHPRKARVPNAGVLAVRVANLAQKDLIIASEPTKYFTEPHYDGYPAVLVRLGEVTVAELRRLFAPAFSLEFVEKEFMRYGRARLLGSPLLYRTLFSRIMLGARVPEAATPARPSARR